MKILSKKDEMFFEKLRELCQQYNKELFDIDKLQTLYEITQWMKQREESIWDKNYGKISFKLTISHDDLEKEVKEYDNFNLKKLIKLLKEQDVKPLK